ncbi:pseudouridine synthase [Denitratisoma oestradiolicum]|nr:pseudouridine synthase [Denitratisoma oestradiolicum]TWO81997.1 pseudouridylate synthase [Denitratisoma oestradiolicum]
MPPITLSHQAPESLPILYRDDSLVAVHKPSGLLVHRSDLARHETRFAVQILRDQLGLPVHPLHRLDRGTSGVLLFATIRGAVLDWSTVRKTYLAVVRGHPDESGEIDHALSRQPDDYERAPDIPAPPQEALTRYRRLATTELPVAVDRYPTSRYALVQLEPVTGRRHQLRRHMKHIAHPIIGDATHGKGRHNRMFAECFDNHRLLLACVELRFPHPVSSQPLTITAPIEGEFARVIRALGWQGALPSAWLSECDYSHSIVHELFIQLFFKG